MADYIPSITQKMPATPAHANSLRGTLGLPERQEPAADGKSVPLSEPASAERPQSVTAAVTDISDYIQTVSRQLQIHVDDVLGSTIVTVLDKATGDVVRQIPQEELVAVSRYLAEQQQSEDGITSPIKGLLLDSEG